MPTILTFINEYTLTPIPAVISTVRFYSALVRRTFPGSPLAALPTPVRQRLHAHQLHPDRVLLGDRRGDRGALLLAQDSSDR